MKESHMSKEKLAFAGSPKINFLIFLILKALPAGTP